MTNLVLQNGTPFNIVEVDGQWYFADALFSAVEMNTTRGPLGTPSMLPIPRELKLVPQSLLPTRVVVDKNKRYGYVPENNLKQYFSSQAFRTSAEASINGATSAKEVAARVANGVNKVVQTLDVKKRQERFNRADNTQPLVVTGTPYGQPNVQGPTNWSGYNDFAGNKKDKGSDYSGWGWLGTVTKEGGYNTYGTGAEDATSNKVYNNATPVLILPDGDGNITESSIFNEDVFLQKAISAGAESIKADQELLKKAGYLPSTYLANGIPDNNYQTALLAIAREASFANFANFQQNPDGSKPIKLNDWMRNMAKNGQAGNNGKSTSTSTSLFQLTEGEARTVLESYYAEAIGRRPSEKEVLAFKKAVEGAAAKKPTVSTSVTTSDGSGNSNTSSTTKQGFAAADAEVMARTRAEADPRANAFLTSTKYFDAFIGALRGPLG